MPERVQPIKEIQVNWKEVLTSALKILGIMDDNFNGDIAIRCKRGGVRNARVEREIE